jgi:HKD family nuclease
MMKTKPTTTSRVVYQGVTEDSLFSVIAEWCKKGAGRKDCALQILSAFASGSGVNAITPLLDIFLADGNTVEIIFGVDRNGTDKSAVRHLKSLAAAYEKQCSVRVFQAPSRWAIFHPKLYIFRMNASVSFVIGSANLTSGGLSSNFESMILFNNCSENSPETQNASSIWKIFANPQPPLKKRYLHALSQTYLKSLLKRLPDKHPQEFKSTTTAVKDLWRPISRLPLPRSTKVSQRTKTIPASKSKAFLLMDVLRETRSTQMQIPLDVVEDFFRIGRRQTAELAVSIWTETGLSQPIERTLVISQGPKKNRLMRRLEMPQIRGLARPLAVVFMRLRGKRRFAFKLIPHYSKVYKVVNRVLKNEGQQGSGKRRFVIGSLADKEWISVKTLLP